MSAAVASQILAAAYVGAGVGFALGFASASVLLARRRRG